MRNASLLFEETDGLHPIFNPLDADNPSMDVSTVAARRVAYSMMLEKGLFRRGGAPVTGAEWEVIAADDPHGFATLTRLVQWRRTMPTINFHLGSRPSIGTVATASAAISTPDS